MPKSQGIVVRRIKGMSTCFKVWYLLKLGITQSETSHVVLYSRGGEPIYYHRPHELCIIDGGPQNQLTLS